MIYILYDLNDKDSNCYRKKICAIRESHRELNYQNIRAPGEFTAHDLLPLRA